MITLSPSVALVFLSHFLPMILWAEGDFTRNSPHHQPLHGKSEHRARMLKRFDQDGDGKLSDEERQVARQEMEQKREKMEKKVRIAKKRFMEKFDTNADNKWSHEEQKAAREAMRASMEKLRVEILQKHDVDGDGKLSREERQQAHKQEHKAMLAQFDVNNDGELDESERDAAFDYMLEHDLFRLMRQMLGRHRPPGSHHHELHKGCRGSSRNINVPKNEKTAK